MRIVGGILFVLLFLATVTVIGCRSSGVGPAHQDLLDFLQARINAWWVMMTVFFLSLAFGTAGAAVLFGFTSFLALREYITLTPTSRADHRALFWTFFIITPTQYLFVAMQWNYLAMMMIPVYAYIFIPVRNVLAGDYRDFMVRAAKIQWGLMICVYFISYAPALLMLLPRGMANHGSLLAFLICVVQTSDLVQDWCALSGRGHPIAVLISRGRTYEGLLAGLGASMVVALALRGVTPFSFGQAALAALAISTMGLLGSLVMAAIKRDRGIKEGGYRIPGHGGMMDRLDSLCFAAPIFYHLTRYFVG